MITNTVVNNHTLEVYPSAQGNSSETAARRFAASLDRNETSVREIKTSVVYDVEVWLDTDDIGESGAAFYPPEGYEIAGAFVGSNGGVCLRINEVSV